MVWYTQLTSGSKLKFQFMMFSAPPLCSSSWNSISSVPRTKVTSFAEKQRKSTVKCRPLKCTQMRSWVWLTWRDRSVISLLKFRAVNTGSVHKMQAALMGLVTHLNKGFLWAKRALLVRNKWLKFYGTKVVTFMHARSLLFMPGLIGIETSTVFSVCVHVYVSVVPA